MQKLGGKTIVAPNSSKSDIDNGNEKTLVTKEWVESKIGQAGGGDMMSSMYDPTNVMADAFNYNNMHNTPDIEIVWGATEW